MKTRVLTGVALGIVIFAALVAVLEWRSAGAVPSLATIKRQVADDEANQYWMARRNAVGHDAREAYMHAKLATSAYLAAGDEENYRKWVLIAQKLPLTEDDLYVERIPLRNDAEIGSAIESMRGAPQSAPPTATQQSGTSMGALLEKMEYVRNNPTPQTEPAMPSPDQPQDTYTYEEKRKINADYLKKQADEAQKKIDDDMVVIEHKKQAKRDSQTSAAAKQKYIDAIGGAPYRPWKTLGGKDTSRARIVAYDRGELTLEKADGKRVDLKESSLSPADKKYLDGWKSQAGLEP